MDSKVESDRLISIRHFKTGYKLAFIGLIIILIPFVGCSSNYGEVENLSTYRKSLWLY